MLRGMTPSGLFRGRRCGWGISAGVDIGLTADSSSPQRAGPATDAADLRSALRRSGDRTDQGTCAFLASRRDTGPLDPRLCARHRFGAEPTTAYSVDPSDLQDRPGPVPAACLRGAAPSGVLLFSPNPMKIGRSRSRRHIAGRASSAARGPAPAQHRQVLVADGSGSAPVADSRSPSLQRAYVSGSLRARSLDRPSHTRRPVLAATSDSAATRGRWLSGGSLRPSHNGASSSQGSTTERRARRHLACRSEGTVAPHPRFDDELVRWPVASAHRGEGNVGFRILSPQERSSRCSAAFGERLRCRPRAFVPSSPPT